MCGLKRRIRHSQSTTVPSQLQSWSRNRQLPLQLCYLLGLLPGGTVFCISQHVGFVNSMFEWQLTAMTWCEQWTRYRLPSLLPWWRRSPSRICTSFQVRLVFCDGVSVIRERTKIPQTIEISKAVGTIRKMIDCKTNVIPLDWSIKTTSWTVGNRNTLYRDQLLEWVLPFVAKGEIADPSGADAQTSLWQLFVLHVVRY